MFSFIVVNGFFVQKKKVSNQFNSLTSPAHQIAVFFFISVVITKQLISFHADSSVY